MCGIGSGVGAGIDLLKAAIWSAAGLTLAYVGVQTAGTLEQLSNSVIGLEIAIVRLESKVASMPPPETQWRINRIEEELSRMEAFDHKMRTELDILRGRTAGSGGNHRNGG